MSGAPATPAALTQRQLTLATLLVATREAGIGIGTFIAPNDSAILGATPPGRLGVAAGIYFAAVRDST